MQAYREERDTLLERAVRLLEVDERVVAVWLHGSIGRGMHDDWSDLDLWIVVADAHIEAVVAERAQFAAHVGEPLLTVEAPQNAPEGGAYLLVMYPGTVGPLILDCSWQPQSKAQRPSDTRLIFDRAGLSLAQSYIHVPGDNALEQAKKQTAFFWMMAAVVAKNIVRGQSWEVVGLLRFVWSTVEQIKWLVGNREAPPTYRDAPPFDVPVGAAAQLAALRALMAEMEELMKRVTGLADRIEADTLVHLALFLRNIELSSS